MFWIFVHRKLYRLSRKLILDVGCCDPCALEDAVSRLQPLDTRHEMMQLLTTDHLWWPCHEYHHPNLLTSSAGCEMMLHFQQQEWSPQYFFLQGTLNVLCIAWHNITPLSSSLSVLLCSLASSNCQNNSTFSYFRSNYLGFEVVLKLFEGQVASLK